MPELVVVFLQSAAVGSALYQILGGWYALLVAVLGMIGWSCMEFRRVSAGLPAEAGEAQAQAQ